MNLRQRINPPVGPDLFDAGNSIGELSIELKSLSISVTSSYVSILLSRTTETNSSYFITGKRIALIIRSPMIFLISCPSATMPRFSIFLLSPTFGPLVIQLVWYVLKQLFTSVSVNSDGIYLAASWLGKYPVCVSLFYNLYYYD